MFPTNETMHRITEATTTTTMQSSHNGSLVVSSSSSSMSGDGLGADLQLNGASGVEEDINRIMTTSNCADSGLSDIRNGQLGGCLTDTADYMSDAFGELCLGPCSNGTGAAAVASGGEQNLTQMLLPNMTGGGLGEPDFLNMCMNRAGNISYLNISCEFELEYATPLYGFCIPVLLFVTVTANLLIVIVLSRRNMATPTNAVLMGKSSGIILARWPRLRPVDKFATLQP